MARGYVYEITRLTRDDYADCVYNESGCVVYFDDFMRDAREGTAYYVGNIVLMG